MGIVKVKALIGRRREDVRELEFLVDTGSFYTARTPAIRDELNLHPGIPAEVQLADKRIIDTEVTLHICRWMIAEE